MEIIRLAAALHSRAPNGANSHPVAAELGATNAIDRFLQEYNETMERKFLEIERMASSKLDSLIRENQTLKTQLHQAQEAGNASQEQDFDKERFAKMQKAVMLAREKIQALEASDSEHRGLVAQRDDEIERLKSVSVTLKKQVEELETKLAQTVDVAKKRVTKLAEEIRDLRTERDDYRKQLGLAAIPPPQTLSRTTTPTTISKQTITSSSSQTSLVSSGNCNVCSLPITDKFYTKTKNRQYHKDCFKCVKCGNIIPEGKYGEDPTDGKPRCASCWSNAKTPRCTSCGDPITDTLVEALGFSYHQGCFKCVSCKTPFDGTFFHLEGQPYCEDCLQKHQ